MHGRDRLQGHKIGDDEGKRSGYQGTFKMLAAQRPFELFRQLTGLGDDVRQTSGTVEGRIDRRTRGR